MYTLRQVTSGGIQSNLCLGDHYQVVRKFEHQDEFEKSNYVQNMADQCREKCFAIIIYAKGDHQEVWPLYENFYYYIMTDSGKTFDNLTFKQ